MPNFSRPFDPFGGAIVSNIPADIVTLPDIGRIPVNALISATIALFDLNTFCM